MPREAVYRMPAEWEPQQATWLAWPHDPKQWLGDFEPIPLAFARLAAEISLVQRVEILVENATIAAQAQKLIERANGELARVRIHTVRTNDSWMRDSGPIFAVGEDHSQAIVNWHFNGWGDKFRPWDLDNEVPLRIAEILQFPRVDPGIILEGGGIDVNGSGTALTTEQCLLHPNRNPHLSKTALEDYLLRYLGISHTIWLEHGLVGDHTDGHTDNVARFVAPGKVVTVLASNRADPNYELLYANYEQLKASRDQSGRPLEVVTLPHCEPIRFEGDRLTASYANFVILNRKVIVPVFDTSTDEEALTTLSQIFRTAKRLVWKRSICFGAAVRFTV